MSVVVVGLNHRTVPLGMLERMTVNDVRLPKALHDLVSREHVREAVLLSTCNRTEIYAVAERYHGAVDDLRRFLGELSGLAIEDFSDHVYAYHDESAVGHLFSVASGLDSVVLGETEILGQVRSAWQKAEAEGTVGPALGRLFRHAVGTGRRARTETGIARGTTSLSHAAVEMAVDRLGGLDRCRILVVGAGDMGEGMAAALASTPGVAEVLVANRSSARGARLAAKVGGRSISLADLPVVLPDVDLLLTSTGSPDVILEAADIEVVMTGREHRPLLVVDIAVPRDVDPAVASVPGVTLLDMDDLRGFAESAVAGRRAEVDKVRLIVAEEVDRWTAVAAGRELAPLVAALRERADQIRAAELERHQARLSGLSARERESVEAVTRAIVNKILHEPTVRLKDNARSPRADSLAEALRVLFDL